MKGIFLLSILQILKASMDNQLVLKGFDCSMEKANFSEISLLDVEKCEKIPTKYKKGREVNIQMLQVSYKNQLDVLQCKVFVSLKVNYCQSIKLLNNHTKPGVYIKRNVPIKVTRPQCHSALNTRTFQFNYYQDELRMVNLEKDDTAYGEIEIRGSIDPNTSGCSPSKFFIHKTFYENHILTMEYNIEINKIKGTLDQENQIFSIDSRVKTTDFKKQSIHDTKEGSFFWRWYQQPKKCNSLKEISKIIGEIHEPIHNSSAPIVIIQSNETSKIAITLSEKKEICKKKLSSTFAEGLYLLIANTTEDFIETEEIDGHDVNQLLNIKTLLSSSILQQEIKIGATFDKVAIELCKNARKNIIRELASYGNKKPDEQKDISLRGKFIINGGSMIRMINCDPITASLRINTTECFADVPVTYNNEEAFLDSVTYIIKKQSNHIHCSSFMPAKFGIEDISGNFKWICFAPNLYSGHNCLPPSTLSPMQHKTLYTPVIHQIDSSIYTKKQLKEYSKPYFKYIENENQLSKIFKDSNAHKDETEPYSLKELINLITPNNEEITINYILQNISFIIWKYVKLPMVFYFLLTILINTFQLICKISLVFQREGLSLKTIILFIIKLITIGIPSPSHNCIEEDPAKKEKLVKEITTAVLADLTRRQLQSV